MNIKKCERLLIKIIKEYLYEINKEDEKKMVNEYDDLFLKCQDTGIYHVFVFDVVNSKKMDKEQRRKTQYQLILLMSKMYKSLLDLEKKLGTKILVFEEDFVSYFDKEIQLNGFGLKMEPFLFGDMFGFTVYRDCIDDNFIYSLFNKYKQELNIDIDFHINDGYYETNDYNLGSSKYFRGYCISLLSNMHKQKRREELEKEISNYKLTKK